MKKLTLAASLALVAMVLAPITSASAAPLKGRCTVEGIAKFTEAPLRFLLPERNKYSFAGPAECEELPSQKKEKGSVAVSGPGELACVLSGGGLGKVALVGETGAPGKGTLTLPSGTYKFTLTFHSLPVGNVALLVKPEGEEGVATGDAEFLTPGGALEKAKVASECVKEELTELPFVAVAAGEL